MGVNTPSEDSHFEDSIVLDKVMTRQEAIRDIANFHNTSDKAVLETFLNLGTIPCEKVVFRERYSGQGGFNYIRMLGLDESGKEVWSSMIHMYTGQPITKVA